MKSKLKRSPLPERSEERNQGTSGNQSGIQKFKSGDKVVIVKSTSNARIYAGNKGAVLAEHEDGYAVEFLNVPCATMYPSKLKETVVAWITQPELAIDPSR